MFVQHAYCPTCAEDSPVEAPPCLDGHDDCPDRVCLTCGSALIVDAIVPIGISERLRPAA